MFRSIAISLALCFATVTADAALLSRAGGQAYYDDVLKVTWLADANLADSTDFGVAGINPNGSMDWDTAQTWIRAMNTANHLGVNNWRLPNIVDTNTAGCNSANTGTDCGYNVDLATGEIAHLYYHTLGNVGYHDTNGIPTGCSDASPYCLTNTGPFSNVQPGGDGVYNSTYSGYWSGTEYALFPDIAAWVFRFRNGSQGNDLKVSGSYAWAVHPGDIATVPAPPAIWLLGTGLGLIGWMRRKVSG